jgi:hypothetical protein
MREKKEKKKERKEKKRGKGNELLFFKYNPQITSSFFSFLFFFLFVSFSLFFFLFPLSIFFSSPHGFLFSSFLRHPNLQSDLHRSPAPIVSPAPERGGEGSSTRAEQCGHWASTERAPC